MLAALVVTALGLLASGTGEAAEKKKQRRTAKSDDASGEVYRWIDDNGVVHFGDAVPAEYAPIDRQVLNQYGITMRTEQGALTEEEIEAALAAARRDEVLLSTYLSVEEIEALRNRRMELIDGQISVTNNYLQSLRDRLKKLQAEANTYKPYSKDPDAEPIDQKLADELADTADSIALYEKTLQDTRTRQGRVVMAFDADIARFKELKSP
jgi:ABC-type phosphate transport system auxiliary subunit